MLLNSFDAALIAINTSRVCTANAAAPFPDFLPNGLPFGDPNARSGISHDVIHFTANQARDRSLMHSHAQLHDARFCSGYGHGGAVLVGISCSDEPYDCSSLEPYRNLSGFKQRPAPSRAVFVSAANHRWHLIAVPYNHWHCQGQWERQLQHANQSTCQ